MNPQPKFRYAGYEGSGTGVKPSTVLELFRRGLDTREIARKLSRVTEADVYNLLALARETERSK